MDKLPAKPRVAVVGCGLLAQATHLPNITKGNYAELHTCCDLNQDYLQVCKERFKPKKLSRDFGSAIADPDIDLVVVATTERFRIPIVEAAAAAGKPVYMEKPVADSWQNALVIQKIVNDSGIPLCVGYNRRASPAMIAAQEIFSSHMANPQPCRWRFDRMGKERMSLPDEDGVASMAIRINDDWHSWKRVHMEGDSNRYGGLVCEMCHFADIACWFMPSPPVAVSCMSSGRLNHVVSLRFAAGELVSIFMGSNGTFGYPKELYEAFGQGAAVVVDHMLEVRTAGIADAPLIQTFPMRKDRHPDVGTEGGLHGWLKKKHAACREAAEANDPMLQFTAEPDKGHDRMLQNFIEEIRGNRSAVCSIDAAMLASQITFAAVRSVEEEREVLLSEV